MRRLLLAGVLLTTAAASPSTADARAFRYGVSAAEVTSNSALLWGRSLKVGKVQLEIALDTRASSAA
jgi:phosphodiesterase/alkaline phosphatase D-like protein